MNSIKTLSAALLTSAFAVGILASAAEASGVSRFYDPVVTGSITPMPVPEYPVSGYDTDSGNAKNPALPDYAQARGQETGGYARELIPN